MPKHLHDENISSNEKITFENWELKFDDAEYPKVITSTSWPSNKPSKIWDIYIRVDKGQVYISIWTGDLSDWKQFI